VVVQPPRGDPRDTVLPPKPAGPKPTPTVTVTVTPGALPPENGDGQVQDDGQAESGGPDPGASDGTTDPNDDE
jgi:rod shape-determining protein MreC